MGHHGPRAPRIVTVVETEAEDGAIVKAEWAPADISRCICPGNPGRRPGASGNPEPRAGREAPPPVVMRRPRPWADTDPRPAIRPHRDPTTVIVRTPADRDRWIPDVSVRGVVLPGAVLIEGRRVGLNLAGQILRGHSEPLIAARFRPAIKRVP